MKNYLVGAVLESVSRAKKIKENIPNESLEAYFYPLIQKCDNLVDHAINNLNKCLEFLAKDNLESYVLEKLRDAVVMLDRIEYGPLLALTRKHDDDAILNNLVDKIRREIKYPINPPLACCLSNDYFYVDPYFNIMYLPTLETNFLLHIPDVYHELGHPLFDANNNPKVEPFKTALGNANHAALTFFDEEIIKEKRKNNIRILESLQNWQENWVRSWTVEVFCDLFGIFTAGPAFAWSHLHLCAKRGGNPYFVPLYNLVDHPADSARMEAMLIALELISFNEDCARIREKWDQFMRLTGDEKPAEFHRAYPKNLIEQCVTYSHQAMMGMKCRIVNSSTDDPMYRLLNSAWQNFYDDPKNYFSWEKEQINLLRTS